MFVRVKRVRSGAKTYEYVQVVETRRDKGRVQQHIVANLGRLDLLLETGDLDRVISGLVAHSKTLHLVQRYRGGDVVAESDKVWGPVLVFGRLWEQLEMPRVLAGIVGRKRLGFDFERAIFAIVLQRTLEWLEK